MFKLFSIIVLFAFLCSVSAIQIYNITDLKIERKIKVFPEENPAEIIKLNNLSHQSSSASSATEEAVFAVNRFETGFARVVRTGVVVTRGASGILNFRIRARGVDSETITQADSSISETLESSSTGELRQLYESLLQTYNGGLNIPWLQLLGYNLVEQFNQQDAQEVFSRVDSSVYNQLASEALTILESFVETEVEISGTITASGVSTIPTTAFAFLRFSRVEFGEDQSTNVFSTNTNDLVAATPGGQLLPGSNPDIDILTPTRR